MEEDNGQFYVRLTTNLVSSMPLGIASPRARFPSFYVKQEKQADELNIPVVHRVRLYAMSLARLKHSLILPAATPSLLPFHKSSNLTNLNAAPMIRTAENIVPIMAKGTEATPRLFVITLAALVSMTWEGTYNNKGIKAV